MSGVIRRRMLGGNTDTVIMTSDTNPKILNILYNAGYCANPDYMLKSEAESIVETGKVLWRLFYGKTDLDEDFTAFKYFTGITYLASPSNQGVFQNTKLKAISLSDSCKAITYCALKTSGSGLFVYCPNVSNINEKAFKSNGKLILVLDTVTPPTITTLDFITNEWGNKLNFEIYVPDTAVQTYKDYFLTFPDITAAGINKTAAQVAGRVYPISTYSYDWKW